MRYKVLLLAVPLAIVAAVIGYFVQQPELAALQRSYLESQDAVAGLQTTNAGMISDLASSQRELRNQQAVTESFRRQAARSIGDRLVLTEGLHLELPKTVVEAEAQGYSLLDTVTSEGELEKAQCFGHADARHYGKLDSKTTSGVEWHGAPFLLLYGSDSGKLMGMVLESTSPQPSPPWESHAEGHPGMLFEHASMHIWFTEPPENLSLARQ